MKYMIRQAVVSDAKAACEVVRRSITDLCVEDHKGDVATLAAWLANKTAANFEAWIQSDRNVAIVAEGTQGLVGFGLLHREGVVALLYVAPEVRFQAVSKGMLLALEEVALTEGARHITLCSTATARRFYLASGYVPDGEPEDGFGLTTSYPMLKRRASE